MRDNLAILVIAIVAAYFMVELAWAEIFNYFGFGDE